MLQQPILHQKTHRSAIVFGMENLDYTVMMRTSRGIMLHPTAIHFAVSETFKPSSIHGFNTGCRGRRSYTIKCQ